MNLTPDTYIALLQVIPTLLLAYILLDPPRRQIKRRKRRPDARPRLRPGSPGEPLLDWIRDAEARGEAPPFDEPDFYRQASLDLADADADTLPELRFALVVANAVMGIAFCLSAGAPGAIPKPSTGIAVAIAVGVLLAEILRAGLRIHTPGLTFARGFIAYFAVFVVGGCGILIEYGASRPPP